MVHKIRFDANNYVQQRERTVYMWRRLRVWLCHDHEKTVFYMPLCPCPLNIKIACSLEHERIFCSLRASTDLE